MRGMGLVGREKKVERVGGGGEGKNCSIGRLGDCSIGRLGWKNAMFYFERISSLLLMRLYLTFNEYPGCLKP